MIVDHQKFGRIQDLGVIEPERLNGKIDAVIIVIGRHADRELRLDIAAGRGLLDWVGLCWNRGRRLRTGLGEGAGKQAKLVRAQPLLDGEAKQRIEPVLELCKTAIFDSDGRDEPRQARELGEASIGEIPGIEVACHKPEARIGWGQDLDAEIGAGTVLGKDQHAARPGTLVAYCAWRNEGELLPVSDQGNALAHREALHRLDRAAFHEHGAGQPDDLATLFEQSDLVAEIEESLIGEPGGERGLARAARGRQHDGESIPGNRGGVKRDRLSSAWR